MLGNFSEEERNYLFQMIHEGLEKRGFSNEFEMQLYEKFLLTMQQELLKAENLEFTQENELFRNTIKDFLKPENN